MKTKSSTKFAFEITSILIVLGLVFFSCKKTTNNSPAGNNTSGSTTGGNNTANQFIMGSTSYTLGSCYIQTTNSNIVTIRQNIGAAGSGLSALVTFKDSVTVRTYNTNLLSSVLNISNCKQSTIYIHDSLNNKYLYPNDGGILALTYPSSKWKMVFNNIKFSSSPGSSDSTRVTGSFSQN